VVAEATGAHQVDAEDERTVSGREEEILPTTPCAREAPADEGGEWGVERLQRGNVGRSGAADGRTRDEGVELPHPSLDFR